jgi:epoxyqueuosine reductase
MTLSNQIVIEKAKELGFDLIGFARADKLEKESGRLKEWLNLGYQASMDYMARNFEKRIDVKNILPDARSVISLAVNYYTEHHHKNGEGLGKVSRYAWGKDYHLVLWEKLELLEEELKKIDPEFNSLSYVDTGPVMDKAWAVSSGIGWLGKHTNIITNELGSWVFLGTIITNCKFVYNEPVSDFCGTCTACIDACPTKAIVDNYLVDANKCISFLTIENKEDIPDNFKNQFDGWLFGCDICQDVCPWNKKLSALSNEKDFYPRGNKEIELSEVIEMSQDQFKVRFETSPVKRTKLSGLKRNAEYLIRATRNK